MVSLHITTTRISLRPLIPPSFPPMTLRRIPIPIISKISHQKSPKEVWPPFRDDTVQTHSPLTPVRSPVRGASDSVSRHDGPNHRGARSDQHSEARSRQERPQHSEEYQGINHQPNTPLKNAQNKPLNLTQTPKDKHHTVIGGLGSPPVAKPPPSGPTVSQQTSSSGWRVRLPRIAHTPLHPASKS